MRARVLNLLLGLALAFLFYGCGLNVERLPTPTGLFPGPPFQPPAPDATPQPALLERRFLLLDWPKTIREKDSELLMLTIAMDEEGQATPTVEAIGGPKNGTPVDIPNIYDTHTILAIARLDMAGVEAYREDIREPLLPGKPVVFRWSIRPGEAGVYRGVVWLRLELIPKAGGAIDEMVLMARPIEIQAVTVFGLPGNLARIFGGIGLVASTLLGFPFLQRWIEERLKRSKTARRVRKTAPEKPRDEEVTDRKP